MAIKDDKNRRLFSEEEIKHTPQSTTNNCTQNMTAQIIIHNGPTM